MDALWPKESRGFFASDFRSIGPDGSVGNRDKVLATFQDGRGAAWARSFDIVDLEIHVYGCDAATVIGTADVRALAAPPDAPPGRIRFLNVRRLEDGRWRYAANQFT